MRNRLPAEYRALRKRARTDIIHAVNQWRLLRHQRRSDHYALALPAPTMLGPRQINEAVHAARHIGLVTSHTLRAAGYRSDIGMTLEDHDG